MLIMIVKMFFLRDGCISRTQLKLIKHTDLNMLGEHIVNKASEKIRVTIVISQQVEIVF